MPPVSSGHQFEHLPLVLRDRGPSAPIPPNPTTVSNQTNRVAHSSGLSEVTGDTALNHPLCCFLSGGRGSIFSATERPLVSHLRQKITATCNAGSAAVTCR